MQSKILHKFRQSFTIRLCSRLCANKQNKNMCHDMCSTSNCLTANTETGLEFSSCMTVNTVTTLEFLKLWHAENENTNKNCNCAMHHSAVLQELNSKSHLKCLSKHSNRKEQTCRTNELTNRLTLERIFLKEHVRHDDDIQKTQGFDACENAVKLNSVRP